MSIFEINAISKTHPEIIFKRKIIDSDTRAILAKEKLVKISQKEPGVASQLAAFAALSFHQNQSSAKTTLARYQATFEKHSKTLLPLLKAAANFDSPIKKITLEQCYPYIVTDSDKNTILHIGVDLTCQSETGEKQELAIHFPDLLNLERSIRPEQFHIATDFESFESCTRKTSGQKLRRELFSQTPIRKEPPIPTQTSTTPSPSPKRDTELTKKSPEKAATATTTFWRKQLPRSPLARHNSTGSQSPPHPFTKKGIL